MSEATRRPRREPQGALLERALAAARRDAPTLLKTVPGGKDENGRTWYYPPTEDVLRAAEGLLNDHALEIRFVSQRMNKGFVRTRFKVVHLPSFEWEYTYLEAPPNSAGPLGVAWTIEQAKRLIRVHILGIKSADDPQLVQADLEAEARRGTTTWRRDLLDRHSAEKKSSNG